MLCQTCGTSNPVGSRYCRQCGTSLPGAQETSQYNFFMTSSNLPAMDPSLQAASLRQELRDKLESSSPKPGQRPYCYIHLVGQNFPLAEEADLRFLLESKLIRKDTPAYHHESGRWYEAESFPQKEKKKKKSRKNPSLSASGEQDVDNLLLAAQYGKEAETAASEGDFGRAIELYERIVSLKVRYPLVKKRLKELRKLKESGATSQPPPARTDKSDPSLPWIPYGKPLTQDSLFSEKDKSLFETNNKPSPLEEATNALKPSPFLKKSRPPLQNTKPSTTPIPPDFPFSSPEGGSLPGGSSSTQPQIPGIQLSGGVPSLTDFIHPNDTGSLASSLSPFSEQEEGTSIDAALSHLSSGKVPAAPKLTPSRELMRYVEPWREQNDTKEISSRELKSVRSSLANTSNALHSPESVMEDDHGKTLEEKKPARSLSNTMELDENDVLTEFDSLEPEELRNLQELLEQKTLEVKRRTSPFEAVEIPPKPPALAPSSPEDSSEPLRHSTVPMKAVRRLPFEGTVSSFVSYEDMWLACLTADKFAIHVYGMEHLSFVGRIELEEACKVMKLTPTHLVVLEHHSRKLHYWGLPSLEMEGVSNIGPQPEDLALLPGNRVAVVDCSKARVDIFDIHTQTHLEHIRVPPRPFKLLCHGDRLLVFHRDEKNVTQLQL